MTIEVFDFGQKVVRDARGETVGGCRRERGVYVRRDNDRTVRWMIKVPTGWFNSTCPVFGADGEEIGHIRKGQLFVGNEHFATLTYVGSSSYEIRGRTGQVLATADNQSRFWHFHQTIKVRIAPSVRERQRVIVAAAVCTIEASATLSE
jgi:hypothetical protein